MGRSITVEVMEGYRVMLGLSWALAGRTLCCNGEHRGAEGLRRSVWEGCV